jgi:hypothetical protein
LGKKDLIKKIPFKKFSLKNYSQKKVAAADCFAAWDIAFYYIDKRSFVKLNPQANTDFTQCLYLYFTKDRKGKIK